MEEFNKFRLSPYYINTRRLAEMTGINIPVIAQRSLNENSGERANAMRFASHVANEVLKSGAFPNLARSLAVSAPVSQPVVATLWDVFFFRGVRAAFAAEQKGGAKKPGSFSASITLGETSYRLSGQLSNDHMYSDTSLTLLSNRRRVLVLGRFEVREELLEVQPYIIGDVIEDLGIGFPQSWAQSVRTYPANIDTFAKVKNEKASSTADRKTLLTIAEDDIKRAFAEIIGEPFVPKDWGGEKSDLQTSRLLVDGQSLSAAFIFKGPSVSREMHPANMGKRGDQLVRAFDEPVDLVVIQHCNKIANTVVRMAEALAVDTGRPRRYCIIDGEDTIRILKAYGMFPPPVWRTR